MKQRYYTLTTEVLAKHTGSDVFCLDLGSVGKRFPLYSSRPGPGLNERIRATTITPEADPFGMSEADVAVQEEEPAFTVVRIDGPIEQRSDSLCAWYDGHDAICERLCEGLETGPVVLCIDSPGGAHAGLQEAVRRVQEKKAETGNKIFVYADEEICSAAYWWAAAVGDEIYGPESMLVGSIGVRVAHVSYADHLAKEGIATTYIVQPGPGKVAFAPELPLSDVGRERAKRDVAVAFDAFAKAVSKSRGLDVDAIKALDADVLPGQLAVDAGLVDGIASYEDVLELAAMTAAKGADMADQDDPKKPVQSEDEDKPEKDEESEDEDKPEKDEESEDEDEDKKDDEDGEDGDEDEDKKDDEDDEDSKKAAPPPERMKKGSVASILGLKATASLPAVKSRAMSLAALESECLKITGAKSAREAVGALRALADDAAQASDLRNEIKALRKANNDRTRRDLLSRLAAANLPGYSRGDLFVDRKVDGKTVSAPAPVYAEMKLATLRGLVEGKLASRSPAQIRSPFQPVEQPQLPSGASASAAELAAKYHCDPAQASAFFAALDSQTQK
jgi:ClpP class serine protease